MKERITYLIIATALIIGIIAYATIQIIGHRPVVGESRAQFVYGVCMPAHNISDDGVSERRCGEVQEQTNTEFLCDKTGNTCWVESK